MSEAATEESGARRSFEGSLGEQLPQQRCQSGGALAEWRSLDQVENGTPSTSPPYWDSDDDDDDDGGPKVPELYGNYTWRIDKFSQINKRELRSNAFEVGGYKWYILIYPQGCDVRNHLSLFLCVANHDKLLPGWSHFAQFTIAVVNKDPKKSKYSDTLHRFWKKEHDWGWKKFMELSKVLDGFIDADTLIIKAQVQVIRERADRPFRCLDCQYRRELVRVYLTNVEQVCRRFVEEQRGKLGNFIEDKARWSSFCAFWLGMDQNSRHRMSRDKTKTILKVVVKHFFIEKEVTSTLVMDSLYGGLKVLEGQNKGKKIKGKYLESEESPVPIVRMENDMFVLVDDVLTLLERAVVQPLPPKYEKGPQNRTKDGAPGEGFNKDSTHCVERRLTDLGLQTIEIFILAHFFSKIEVEYQEAVALEKQEELIREEEAAWLAEIEQKARRGVVDREKKSKKKKGKQKRNNRKSKDKGNGYKSGSIAPDKIEEIPIVEKKDLLSAEPEVVLEKSDFVEDVSDMSDSAECVPEILLPDSEDRDASLVNWDTDTSEAHPPTEASSSGISGLSSVQNGTEERSSSIVDDSSSTGSSDSVLSVAISVHKISNSHYQENRKSPRRGHSHHDKLTSDRIDYVGDEPDQLSKAMPDVGNQVDESQSSKLVESLSQAAHHSIHDRAVNRAERHVGKEEESDSSHGKYGAKDVSGEVSGEREACVPRRPSKKIPSIASPKSKLMVNVPSGLIVKRSSHSPRQADRSVCWVNSAENAVTLISDTQKIATSKPSGKPSRHQGHGSEKPPTQPVVVITDKPKMPVLSRPLSAPLSPRLMPAVSVVSVVQTAPVLASSISAAGWLRPEPTASPIQSYAPQSYRNAIVDGSITRSSAAYSQNHSASSVSGTHWEGPHHKESSRNLTVDCASLPNCRQSFDTYHSKHVRSQDHIRSGFQVGTSGRQSHVLPDEFPHLDIINDLLDDEHGIGNMAISNSGNQSIISGRHHLNRQFSFPGDPGMGLSTSSCRFERTRSYQDDGFQHIYDTPATFHDTLRELIPQASSLQYVNGQVEGLIPNQWRMVGSDLPFLTARSTDSDGHPYQMPQYQNLTVGVNSYPVFRPSNGL